MERCCASWFFQALSNFCVTIWPYIHVKTPHVCDSHRKSPRLKNANSASLLKLAYLRVIGVYNAITHWFTASLIHSLTVLGTISKSIAIHGCRKPKGKLIYPHSCSAIFGSKFMYSVQFFLFWSFSGSKWAKRGEFLWGTYTFCCHHLSHKDVHFTAKQCGEFTAIFFSITVRQWLFIYLLLWFIRLQLARNDKLKI